MIQRGFTLIEILIVVAVIGILAYVGIPMYQGYTTKAKWSDNTSGTAALRQSISQCIQVTGNEISACDSVDELKIANGLPGLPTVKHGIVKLLLNSAEIVVEGSVEVGSCTVTWTPVIGTSSVSWISNTTGPNCDKSKTGL